MKKGLLLSALLIVGWVSSTLAGWERMDTLRTYWPNGQLKEQWTEVPDEFNPPDAPWVKMGDYRSWHENGQLAEETQYHQGYLDGWYRSWYPNGQLKEEGRYLNGKDGIWISWREDGQRSTEASYRASLKHGKQVTYCEGSYPTCCTEEHFWFGKLHGLTTRLRGAPEERGRVFYFNGEALVSFLKDGDSDCFYGESGEYYNADHDLWIEWDSGWAVFWVGRKVDGKKAGEWRSWSPNGETQIVQYPTSVSIDSNPAE